MSTEETEDVDIVPEHSSMLYVSVKDEPYDDDDNTDISINPLENVKVEYDESDETPIEPGSSLDPLANVEVEYAHDDIQETHPKKSRRSKDSEQSIVKSDSDCLLKSVQCEGYTEIEIILSSKQLKSAGRMVRRKFLKHYSCDKCSLRTKNKSMMLNHIVNHKDVYKCDHCEFWTPNSMDYSDHLGKAHMIYQVYICDQCNFQTLLKMSLVKHIKFHFIGKDFGCDVCPYKAARESDLIRHMKSKHEYKIACEECDLVFRNRSEKRSHMYRSHRDKDNNRILCDLCSFTSKDVYEMTRHKHKKHLNSIIDSVNSDMLI